MNEFYEKMKYFTLMRFLSDNVKVLLLLCILDRTFSFDGNQYRGMLQGELDRKLLDRLIVDYIIQISFG